MKIMTVRAPDILSKDLAEISKARGQTRNSLVLQILWEWVKEYTETAKRQNETITK